MGVLQSSLISTVVDYVALVRCQFVLQSSLISTVVDTIAKSMLYCFAIFPNFYCCRLNLTPHIVRVLQSSLISTVVDKLSGIL